MKTLTKILRIFIAGALVISMFPMGAFATVSYTGTPNDPDYNRSSWQTVDNYAYAYSRSWGEQFSSLSTIWGDLSSAHYGARAAASSFPIAVIDTGFYMDHPDKGDIIAKRDEFSSYTKSTDTLATDGNVTPVLETAPNNTLAMAAHGTAAAGLIGAGTNNGLGIAGIGYDAQVWVYKVQGIWTDAHSYNNGVLANNSAVVLDIAVTNAIRHAAADGAKIILISAPGPYYSSSTGKKDVGLSSSSTLQSATEYANSLGALVIAPVGNEIIPLGSTTSGGAVNKVMYPAANAGVIGVGSFSLLNNTADRVRSNFTNFGPGLDIMAPGILMWSLTKPDYQDSSWATAPPAGYQMWFGTSMAAASFASQVGLVWRFAPWMSATEITNLFYATAVSPAGGDATLGHGYSDPLAAYNKLKADYPELAAPSVNSVPAYVGSHSLTAGWSTVAGTAVSYDVFLDSNRLGNTGSTSYALGSLSEGHHSFAAQAVSNRNWYSDSSKSSPVGFIVDTIAPVVGGFSYDSGTAGIHWNASDANGFIQRYRIDGGTESTTSASSASVAGIAEGAHYVEVNATDVAGNSSGWQRYDFSYIIPPDAPTLPSVNTTVYSSSYNLQWVPAAGATGYRVRLNDGTSQDVSDAVANLTLLPAANTVQVCSVRSVGGASATSAWVTAGSIYYMLPKPTPPVLSLGAVIVSTPSIGLSWTSSSDADGYDYMLNGVGVVNAGAALSTVISSGIKEGPNMVQVRGHNATTLGDWSSSQLFTYAPPVPAAPAPVPSVLTTKRSVTYSWPGVPYAHYYEYRINAGAVASTTAESVKISSFVEGSNNIFEVRSVGYSGIGDWGSAVPVEYIKPLDASILTTATSGNISYGTGASLGGTLWLQNGLSTQTVDLQCSYDGSSWTTVDSTSTDFFGAVVFSFVPQRSAYYRLQFDDGGVTYALADSASVHFGVYPQVPTPSISKASHPYKNKKVGTKYVRINGKRTRVNVYRKVYNKTIYNYRTYGTINPAAAGSGASVVLEFYWRSSSHAKWSSKPVYRRGASTSVSDTLASYSLSTSLRMKHGLWRVRAVFGSRNFSGSVSGYRNFTVK